MQSISMMGVSCELITCGLQNDRIWREADLTKQDVAQAGLSLGADEHDLRKCIAHMPVGRCARSEPYPVRIP